MSAAPAGGPAPRASRTRISWTGRRWVLVICTAALGALGSSSVLGFPPAERTFAGVLAPVELLMSVLVPLIGIVLAFGLRQPRSSPGRVSVVPTITAALLLAGILAVVGILFAALALLLTSTTAPAPWRGAMLLVVGSLLTQVVAVLTGTGLGLLAPSRVLAFVITLLPAPLWLALGLVGPFRALRDWILPYGAVRHLLEGAMTIANWGQLLVVLGLWGLGLNALGARKL